MAALASCLSSEDHRAALANTEVEKVRALRNIVVIDEEKCNGCGLCVPDCREGAIQIVEGKARLVKEQYCDGLGACLGSCPQDAISIEQREAEEFDSEEVARHLGKLAGAGRAKSADQPAEPETLPCGCPGAASRTLHPTGQAECAEAETTPSHLSNWPVQLSLVPPQAPYLQDAKLLISADCVPFAVGDFHRRFLGGRTLLVGCPKLDDADFYRRKLAEIFRQNELRTVEVLHMEVPCCSGLVRLVEAALAEAGKAVAVTATKIGVNGEVLETRRLDAEEMQKSAEVSGA